MPDRSDYWWNRPEVWAGAALAGAAAVESFRPSLMPRTTTHQALVTGASGTLGWAAGSGTYSVMARTGAVPGDLAILGGTVAAGVAIRTVLPDRDREPAWRPLIKSASTIAAAGAASASTVAAIRYSRSRLIAGSITGGVSAAAAARAIHTNLRRQERHRDEFDVPPPSPTRAIVEGLGALGVLGALLQGYRMSGGAIAKVLQRRTGMPHLAARLSGNALGAAAWGMGAWTTYRFLSTSLALYDRVMDPGYDRPPVTPNRTAGPDSSIEFARIGRQGRRFVTNVPTVTEIEDVMGEPAVTEPIRVFVGYDSARTGEERVALAMQELNRTNAFDRSLLIVSCPAGTGYVNTLPMEVADYATRGDVAAVAVQYARLPSLMALQQTRSGAEHHRLLLTAIRDELDRRHDARRPMVVVYGESLGSWAGQDAFIDSGTRGLDELGVDLALWVGTPSYSKWRDQFLAGSETDFPAGAVVEIDHVGQLDPSHVRRRRVVLLTHDNDPIAHVDHSVLYKRPPWLGSSRPATVSPDQRWMPGISGVQSILDTVNATNPTPGVFRATGHDYRADLPAVTVAAYRLPEPSVEQWERMMAKLQADEAARAARFHLASPDDPGPDGAAAAG